MGYRSGRKERVMIIGGGDKDEAKTTEAQEHENRSRAMLGNENAKGNKGGDGGKGYTAKLCSDLREKLRPQFGFYKNKKTGIEANLSEKSVNKISSEKAIEKSKANGFTVEEHFEVAERIAELYENADLAETSPDKKGSLDLKSIKRFDSEVTLSDGKKAVAHITVKESVQNGHKIYSVEVMDLEQKRSRSHSQENGAGVGLNQNSLPQANSTIPQSFDSVKKNSEISNKPQTDAQMKEEKEKTQKAREKAKYPKRELFVCESMGRRAVRSLLDRF